MVPTAKQNLTCWWEPLRQLKRLPPNSCLSYSHPTFMILWYDKPMSNYTRLFLQGFNYLFITVVTNGRQKILIENIDILRQSFKSALDKFAFEIYAAVIMPDHMHLIIKVEHIEDYPKILYLIKYKFSLKMPKNAFLSPSKIKKGEKGIWQRRYWEHTIRDEEDMAKHLDYIHFNPIKHGYVKTVGEYKYSSFKKFVKMGFYDDTWCNAGDKNQITGLDFE